MSSLPNDFDILESLDYVDRDFDTIYERLLDLAQSAWPTWARLRASWDNFLLGLMAFNSDAVHFYRDNRLRETFLRTAKLRESVIMLGELLGYTLYGPTPASADLTFTLTSGVAVADVMIPAGTVITTSGRSKLYFKLLSAVVITAGDTTGTGSAENATARTETRTSDGSADQRHLLAYADYIDGTMTVVAANGAYTIVGDFLSSGPTDLHCVLTVNTLGKPIVQFGDGLSGEVPQGSIAYGFDTGGGRDGNVEADTITKLSGSFTDGLGNPVTLSVTNATEASGGDDAESVAHAKRAIPASLGNVRTTVSWEDYKNNAELVPGVARAVIITSDQDTTLPENTGNLYIAAKGTDYSSGYVPPATPTQALLDDVQTMIEVTRPKTITFEVNYLPVAFEDVDHLCTAYFEEGYTPATVAAAMLVRLQDFYAVEDDTGEQLDNAMFGFEYRNAAGSSTGELPWSDVFNVLRDTEGVRKIDAAGGLYLNGLSQGVQLGKVKMPRLGSLAVVDGDTGSTVS